jgi:hypothetical protein
MKKKIAFCLRGAMDRIKSGHYHNKNINAIYSDKPYINYIAVFESIKIHITNNINNNDYEFDFFIHSWNSDLQDDLVNLYKPKAYKFENQIRFKKKITQYTINNYGYTAQQLGIHKVIKILQKYVNHNNVKYDAVIIYRPDVILYKNMDLHTYNFKNVYVNSHTNQDFHFIMNYKNCLLFLNIFGSKQTFKNYITNIMKTNLLADDIKCGIHQEVLRKLKFACIDRHNISRNIFYIYGLTDDEIDNMTHQ